MTDPVRARRARIARFTDIGQRVGYGCFGAAVVGYYFESRVADCLERNRQRTGRERVPDVALYATRKRLCRPSLAEGFDRLFYVRLLGEGRFEVLDWDDNVPDNEAR